MYGDGAAEELVGEAIAGRRDEVFLVSKVLPAARDARRDDRRLRAQPAPPRHRPLDLYLLHWRGARPARGDARRLRRAAGAPARSATGASATSTSPTWKSSLRIAGGGDVPDRPGALQPRRAAASSTTCCPGARSRDLPIMAYSPIEQGRLLGHPVLRRHRGAARRDAGAGRAGLGAAARRRQRDPEGRHARACAGEPRRAARPPRRRTISPRSTRAFPPPPGRSRSRCSDGPGSAQVRRPYAVTAPRLPRFRQRAAGGRGGPPARCLDSPATAAWGDRSRDDGGLRDRRRAGVTAAATTAVFATGCADDADSSYAGWPEGHVILLRSQCARRPRWRR